MSDRKIIAVIPARMASSRFPGKPLAKILDLPMIEHVRRRVCLSEILNEAYVATCDQSIKNAVEGYNGKVIMTSDSHQRCTDRVAEAVGNLHLNDQDIIAVISGDEPLFPPELIEVLVKPMLDDPQIVCTNIVSAITGESDMQDKDVVKAVLDLKGRIMCFSRSAIPYERVKSNCPKYRQTGLAAFTKKFLLEFSALSPTPLEIAESVDFMRILEHGHSIQGVIYNRKTIGVDQKEHVPQVEEVLRQDPAHQRIYTTIANI
jgi:3-deoxy-manno-octulosonate cytidylyltransferase (CMP-KDO synthetase)